MSSCNVLHKINIHVGHRCSKPGCGDTLVVDGNMKVHRTVCAVKDAGFTQFEGVARE